MFFVLLHRIYMRISCNLFLFITECAELSAMHFFSSLYHVPCIYIMNIFISFYIIVCNTFNMHSSIEQN